MLLVVGATGNVGRHLLRELAAAGAEPRALARTLAAREAATALGAVPVAGSLDDRASLTRAFDGVERLFLLSPPDAREVALQSHAIDAAAAAGVRLLVKLSVTGADPTADNVLQRDHGEIEARATALGVPSVFLRPTHFMQNLLASADSIAGEGRLYSPPTGPMPLIDAADVAAVAARVLLDDGHAGNAYELTGGAAHAYPEIAAILSGVLGREITHVKLPSEVVRGAMLGRGMEAWLVDALLDLYARSVDGEGTTPTGHVAAITGRAPRTLAEFAREHAAAFTR
ncbi:NmrA family NAD(P)-binding protein [Roseisolibacter agri]|uniref:Nucleotide-diphosphate-sugar epimerase n=1 Tax=Roseisolibacter agri TaxID=2014610 RepID=A0AA37VCG9_9BACT|nr:NmrA family NAD(P)-binding protein [Roseisolibacter agri]GLC27658.1 nucleotide-diphosphate-sugar epimerase [Roseisolibacter agri]